MEQRQLVERARRGDGDAFAALVRPHLGDMIRLARLLGRSANDAEDIVQESLTRVMRSLGRFDPDRPFRPWMATIVANQSRNWQRSGMRRQRLTARIAQLAEVGPRATDEEAIANEEGASLLRFVGHLESTDREILGLRFLLGLSERETAEAMNCSLGTVKSRTSRALARLRADIANADEFTPNAMSSSGDHP